MRLLATAFLINGSNLLLMRRYTDRKSFPSKWAPIGGHLEATEMNDPQVSCIREIGEETGLAEGDLNDLFLRYILHRRRNNEIRIQYISFGFTQRRDVGRTEEGELHWVQLDSVLDLDISATTRFTLEHYLRLGSQTSSVYVGTVDAHDGKPVINWATLRDWE